MKYPIDSICNYLGAVNLKSARYCHDTRNAPVSLFDGEYSDQDKIFVKEIGETISHTKSVDISAKAHILRSDSHYKPLFRYFLDGSRRTYKADDFTIDKRRVFPVLAGQIVVATCERKSADIFSPIKLHKKIVLVLPDKANKDGLSHSKFANEALEVANRSNILTTLNLKFDEVLIYKTDNCSNDIQELEKRGIARIQDAMVDLEKQSVVELARENMFSDDFYLVKDGSLEYQKLKSGNYRDISLYKNAFKHVIGISKRPSLIQCVDNKGLSNVYGITNVKTGQRTPVLRFKAERSSGEGGEVFFGCWYLRIRDSNRTSNPLDGIIKIEKILDNTEVEKGIDSELVDYISAQIFIERFPVCYGSDKRWPNHLYPVFLTEEYVKSKFLYDSMFFNLIQSE